MYKIIQGIKNLIYWFPVIWKDRNWCYWSTFEILEYKLKTLLEWYSSDEPNQVEEEKKRVVSSLEECLDKLYYCQSFEDCTHPIFETKHDTKRALWLEEEARRDFFLSISKNITSWWD